MDTNNNSAPNAPVTPPNAAPPEQKKSKTGLIVGLILGFVFLFVIIPIVLIIIFVLMRGDDKKTNTSSNTGSNSTQREPQGDPTANAEVATSASDFKVLCEGGSISNAADNGAPYKIAAFAMNTAKPYPSWSTESLPYNSEYRADHDKPTSINAVACLDEVSGSAVKSKACEFTSSGEKISIDYFSVKYKLTLREAKTGKVIDESKTVNGPANTCPMFASYNKEDPKLHADPDEAALELALKDIL